MRYPIDLRFRGLWGREDIIMVKRPWPRLPDELKNEVELRWNTRVEEMRRDGITNLASNPMPCAESVLHRDLGDGRLVVIWGMSDFATMFGTTSIRTILPLQHHHHHIGISVVTVTSDEKVVIGWRSGKITYGHMRHVVPGARAKEFLIHPYDLMVAEYEKELGIFPDEISRLDCIAVIRHLIWGNQNFDFIGYGRVSLTAKEVQERAAFAQDAYEHERIEVHDWNERLFKSQDIFADARAYEFVPDGRVALLLALEHDFGEVCKMPEWEPVYCTLAEYLAGDLK